MKFLHSFRISSPCEFVSGMSDKTRKMPQHTILPLEKQIRNRGLHCILFRDRWKWQKH